MRRVKVALQAADPLTMAGLVGHLDPLPDVVLLPSGEAHLAEVRVVAADRLSGDVLAGLRRTADVGTPVVLVVTELEESELATAVECRVVAVLPKVAATAERLRQSVMTAAAGYGLLPPNLIGALIKDVERLQRQLTGHVGDAPCNRLTQREIDVLRMMADGFDTAEIAVELSYSERTVKSVIYGVTTRFNLRNRPHAVAYAFRSGLI